MTQEPNKQPQEQPIQQAPIKETPAVAEKNKKSWQQERQELSERLSKLEARLEANSRGNVQSPLQEKPALPPTPIQAQEESHEGHNHAETENKPHFVGSWQKFCPSCGDPNPEFKDEVYCEGCKGNLGAYETASKLKACPNCGSKKAKRR